MLGVATRNSTSFPRFISGLLPQLGHLVFTASTIITEPNRIIVANNPFKKANAGNPIASADFANKAEVISKTIKILVNEKLTK